MDELFMSKNEKYGKHCKLLIQLIEPQGGDMLSKHCNFIGAILAPRGRFGFLEVGPFWLHTGAKIEHWGHFGTRMGYFGPTLRGRFCHV